MKCLPVSLHFPRLRIEVPTHGFRKPAVDPWRGMKTVRLGNIASIKRTWKQRSCTGALAGNRSCIGKKLSTNSIMIKRISYEATICRLVIFPTKLFPGGQLHSNLPYEMLYINRTQRPDKIKKRKPRLHSTGFSTDIRIS